MIGVSLRRSVGVVHVQEPVPHHRAVVVGRAEQCIELKRVVRVPQLQIVLAGSVIAIPSELLDRTVWLLDGNIEGRRTIGTRAGIGQIVFELEAHILPALGTQFQFQTACIQACSRHRESAPVGKPTLRRLLLRIVGIHKQSE